MRSLAPVERAARAATAGRQMRRHSHERAPCWPTRRRRSSPASKALALDIDEIGAPALKAALDETCDRIRAEAATDRLADDLAARRMDVLAFAGASAST